jgi:hypothetical protein
MKLAITKTMQTITAIWSFLSLLDCGFDIFVCAIFSFLFYSFDFLPRYSHNIIEKRL